MTTFPAILKRVRPWSLVATLGLAGMNSPAAEPLLSSWTTTNSAKYARVYKTTSARSSGTTSTTWTNQVLPTYSDIQEISYSTSWVYVKYSGLASYVMGPWLNPQGGVFQFWPTNQHGIRRFPRSPAVQSGTKDTTSGGYSGLFINGVAIFNALDGQAWDGSQIQGQAPHTQSTYYWHRNAPVAESFNFDDSLGHQPPSGVYHTHQNPLGLRYQLGDHVDYNSSTKAYSESASAVTQHSPILGWAHDGYPVYGPYGYGTATDANSSVRRMVPGYVKRDGSNGTDSLASNLSTIPAWYARFRQNHFGGGYSTTAGASRASVNATYPLGTFAQDWAYLGDLTNPADSQLYEQGVDFDLDEYNGRYCVTPEYPGGTYAYFTAIDSSGSSSYPYVLAFEFYGNATGGSVSSITESVTSSYVGGPNKALQITATNAASDTITLTWSSVEGGTYQVESSANQTSWTTQTAALVATAASTQSSYTGAEGAGYARVTRTALASYDTVVTGATAGSQTATASYTVAAPVWYVKAARTGQGSQNGTSWATAFASLQDAIASASSGDEIWVAAGVYYGDESEAEIATVVNDSQISYFHLKEGVAIYGGFAGTETARSQRDSTAHVCVLSGDIDHETNPDVTTGGVVVSDPASNIVGANAYQVVDGVFNGNTILDGFTITGGIGGGSSNGGYFRRCVFQGNKGTDAGAVYHEDDTVTYVQCDFINNQGGAAGAINAGGTNIRLDSCRILGNETTNSTDTAATIAIGSSTAIMVNCLVAGNQGNGNGAIYVPAVPGVTTPLDLENCTIAGNRHAGGATGVTAGGLAVADGVTVQVSHTIIWGNSGAAQNNLNGTISAQFSLIEGAHPAGDNFDGTNPAYDPLFLSPVAASSAPSSAGDYRLQGQSPVIGAGLSSENPADTADLDEDGDTSETIPYDLAGNARVVVSLDIGAYEYSGPTVTTAVNSQTVATSAGATTVADLDNVFSGAGLTFGLSASGNSGLFDATLGAGNVVTVTPLGGTGTGTVTVTATDSAGNQYSLTFTVTLQEAVEPANGLTQNLNSWLKAYSGRYARIYRTYADEQAGAAQTTWDNGTYAQTLPAYGGAQKIQHSDNYIYVTTTGLSAGHVMGPWYNDTGPGGSLEAFQNWPEAIYTIYRLPAQPVIPATKTTFPSAAIGLMIDGTIIFSESDTFSWDNNGDGTGNGVDTGPGVQGGGMGDGLWLHDAYLTEGNTFDKSNAHSAGNQIHYHASPMKLRHLLGDSVDAVQQPDGAYLYGENFNGQHSPILGWMNDGLPLYGPYGYGEAMNTNSAVRRMVSGFIVRNGQNGSYNTAANGRTSLPAWSARYRNRSTACTINEQGPTAATLAVPYFMEDYDYLGDLTNPADGQPYEQGVDFDLNEFNVRWCVTPEFPNGTWAYFVSIGADGNPAFPYNVGAQFYGDPSTGGGVTTIGESVTTDWLGGPDSELKMNTPTVEGGTVTLTWSAVEGGTYVVEVKGEVSDALWDAIATGVSPTLDVGQATDGTAEARRFYQARRTALAPYDETGATTGGGTGGGGGGGSAPTISSVTPNSGTEGSSVNVSITLSGAMLPPAEATPTVTIGTVSGTSVTYNGTTVSASFALPAGTTGAQTVTVTFPAPPGGDALVLTSPAGFTINAMSGGGGGGGGVVTFNATFATNPPLPPQNAIEASAVGGVTATITSFNQATGAVTLQFDNTTLASGNYSATLKFTPPGMSQQTITSTNQYTKN